MCGIVGVIGKQDESWIKKMNSVQVFRGPDEEGYFFDKEDTVSLAMKRLSIIDISEGHQPMTNEDSKVWIVFNGEIFNAVSLRKILESKGHCFSTDHSDTEVLIHLYEEFGKEMLGYLNGMFGFVIYDKNKKCIFGARDRMGIKPLYYYHTDKVFAFASEMKSLLQIPEVPREVDFQSIYHYLSLQFIPSPFSIFSSIKKLPAAHYFFMDINTKVLKVEKYWDITFKPIIDKPFETICRELRTELREAVKRWAISDVPIGCSLSGGIDSSAILGLLGEQGVTGIKTFCLGFEENEADFLDERKIAKKVAQKWGTEHYETILNSKDLLSDLDNMVWHLDEPYGGGLPSWYIYKEMGKHVKVAITGSGGDELFGNYGKWIKYEDNILKYKFKMVELLSGEFLGEIIKNSEGSLYHRYFRDGIKQKKIFRKECLTDITCTTELYQNLWNLCESKSPRDKVPYIDFKMQLPDEFMHMTDRFSMAHSVEARVPFLDHQLVENVLKIPYNIRTSKAKIKYLLIQSVKDLLIEEVTLGQKKGFTIPFAHWIRNELREKTEYYLGIDFIRKQGIFNQDIYNRFVKPHMDGTRDNSWQIWTLLMFQLWHNKFIVEKA